MGWGCVAWLVEERGVGDPEQEVVGVAWVIYLLVLGVLWLVLLVVGVAVVLEGAGVGCNRVPSRFCF